MPQFSGAMSLKTGSLPAHLGSQLTATIATAHVAWHGSRLTKLEPKGRFDANRRFNPAGVQAVAVRVSNQSNLRRMKEAAICGGLTFLRTEAAALSQHLPQA